MGKKMFSFTLKNLHVKVFYIFVIQFNPFTLTNLSLSSHISMVYNSVSRITERNLEIRQYNHTLNFWTSNITFKRLLCLKAKCLLVKKKLSKSTSQILEYIYIYMFQGTIFKVF